MASCSAERVSDSSLSPPTEPNSPSVVARYLKSIKSKVTGHLKFGGINGNPFNGAIATTPAVIDQEVDHFKDKPIRPYINPVGAFDYYDRLDEREASVTTANNSQEPEDPKSGMNGMNGNGRSSSEEKFDIPNRFPFPKFTPIEDFEHYLAAPEDMDYDVLYLRTDGVSDVMGEYQKEWDTISKEIYAHESYLKAQAKDLAEQTKELEEEKAKVEDQKCLEIAEDFRAQLRLSRSDWEKFLEKFEKDHPKETILLDRLRNLRLPNFLAGIHKRQKAREPDPIKLADRPLTAERVTKEEINMDRRKRGRLMDPITFDDMKHADAYGFNYSSQPHHVGNQPQPTFKGDVKTRGEAEDEGRGRSRRNKAQKNYDADKSVTPETDSDELPAKRVRRPRINLDVPAASPSRTRTIPQSGSSTPIIIAGVKTFKSGKRVGRPPSALKNVEAAPVPEAAPVIENEPPRKLAPKQEEQLQHAAKSLVKKTHSSGAQPADVEMTQTPSAESSRPSTSSSTQSKKRKRGSNNPEPDTVVVDAPINEPGPSAPTKTESTPAPASAASRKRKAKEEEIDESTLDPEALEKLRKKRIKSAKLSESLRKRWEGGHMAGAMETRRVTNAAKKAAKEAAAVPAAGGTFLPAAPAIAPNPPAPRAILKPTGPKPAAKAAPKTVPKITLKTGPKPAPKAIQPQPAGPELAAAETPVPKRKKPNPKPAKAVASGSGKKGAPGSAVPPSRKPSGRKRKPTRTAMGMDGAADSSEEDREEGGELQQQFKSEYEHYQALTSPGSPILLGKRARRTKMDLQAEVFDDGEEMDESE